MSKLAQASKSNCCELRDLESVKGSSCLEDGRQRSNTSPSNR